MGMSFVLEVTAVFFVQLLSFEASLIASIMLSTLAVT